MPIEYSINLHMGFTTLLERDKAYTSLKELLLSNILSSAVIDSVSLICQESELNTCRNFESLDDLLAQKQKLEAKIT
jgi:hypothetical protein